MNKIALLYSTLNSMAEAEKLAEEAVTQKFAACVNIIPQATSIFMWENSLQKSSECLLLFKTSRDKIETLQEWLKTKHPYTLPAILCGDIESSPEFCHYIQQCTNDEMRHSVN